MSINMNCNDSRFFSIIAENDFRCYEECKVSMPDKFIIGSTNGDIFANLKLLVHEVQNTQYLPLPYAVVIIILA